MHRSHRRNLRHGWGIPIGTDTAFAVALIVLLGDRVPIELRVFLTAAVIIDDIVAIAVIALFYTGEIHAGYLIAGGAVTALLVVLNRRRRVRRPAVRGLRRRPLVLPSRGRTARHAGGRDPGRAHPRRARRRT